MHDMILRIALLALPVLIAVTVHEVAHGWIAFKLGDNTAQQAGRLTLNPIKHLDLFGTLVFIITQMVGWAKPVPVNPYNLKNPRKDMIWVAAAGPAANILMAVGFSLLYHLTSRMAGSYPSDMIIVPVLLISRVGVIINVGLATFNLLPVPPLDGSNIAMGLLPRDMARIYQSITPYGFLILLVLIFSGLVDKVIFPIISFMTNLLLYGQW
ncbi:MAG: site-2 protease family protein [Deltaproteobacteria bacterium]|nr:site-2 protease family protein [Deltaproteobacteria bacterium]MBW2051575.1 site-2 protease family protein [Deltaproteobacteria bacterium]MBW2139880.1 site-2 protease family protein [Deltaproteobacteria bacterium]MBW2323209.1 site-2 protease family protein [Deltaproteobacteria bacterium]